MNTELSIEELKKEIDEMPAYILRKMVAVIDEYMREKDEDNNNAFVLHSEN